MPGTGGLELRQRLHEAGHNTPIIFMTAHEDSRVRLQALAAGAVAFLQKPLDDRTLLDAVYKVLGEPPSLPEHRGRHQSGYRR